MWLLKEQLYRMIQTQIRISSTCSSIIGKYISFEMSPHAALAHLHLFCFMCGLLWPALLLDNNVRRVACSAVKSITASTAVTAMCLPLDIFISYANTDPMEPVIIHQELSPNGNCFCPAHSLFISMDRSGSKRLHHKHTVSLIPLFISLFVHILKQGKTQAFFYAALRPSCFTSSSLVLIKHLGRCWYPCSLLTLMGNLCIRHTHSECTFHKWEEHVLRRSWRQHFMINMTSDMTCKRTPTQTGECARISEEVIATSSYVWCFIQITRRGQRHQTNMLS